MTETEWLSSPGAWAAFEYVQPTASQRKLRLFGCACCHRIWHLLDRTGRAGLEIAERYADGAVSEAELANARLIAVAAVRDDPIDLHATLAVMWIVDEDASGTSWDCSTEVTKTIRAHRRVQDHYDGDVVGPEREVHALILRDVFGNPFRPVVFDAEWLTSTVVALARDIYEKRAFDQMPILADALQDAGCDNADVLNHCRDPQQVHVRGCWVVDGVLGKA